MTTRKPGWAAFTAAKITLEAAAILAITAIWTGDHRWWGTAAVLAALAIITGLRGAAQAAAAEKHEPFTLPVQTTNKRPGPDVQPPNPAMTPTEFLEFNKRMNNDKDQP